MSSRILRTVELVVGLILLVVGVVFAGQGANLIPGSFMTGDRTWLGVGIVLAVIGVVLIAAGLRRRRRPER